MKTTYSIGNKVTFNLDNNPAKKGEGVIVQTIKHGYYVALLNDCDVHKTGATILVTLDEITNDFKDELILLLSRALYKINATCHDVPCRDTAQETLNKMDNIKEKNGYVG